MIAVGAFEAKTHLSALLERVAGGERIAITRHGTTVALLIPVEAAKSLTHEQAIAGLRHFRRGRKASRKLVRKWIAEGRA
jgi:prevent-host-death family protein